MKKRLDSHNVVRAVAARLIRPVQISIIFVSLLDFKVLGASGTWTFATSMTVARSRHTSTVLPDGRVLVVGGLDADNVATTSAELYDPIANTWQTAPHISQARSRHTATVLVDGRVLIAGGRGANELSLASAEVFDPASDAWTSHDNMAIARDIHTATLLDDGRVLVSGGVSVNDRGPFVQKTAEIYDPITGTWTMADHMANARFGHEALLLPDGRVLVAGGATPGGDCTAQFTAEIYDLNVNRWSNTRPMQTLRSFYFAAAIPGLGMLAAGGLTVPPDCQNVSATTEIYDAATASWRPTGNLSLPRGAIVPGGRLPSGKLLVAGARSRRGPSR